jgi:hypothetical protein
LNFVLLYVHTCVCMYVYKHVLKTENEIVPLLHLRI